MQPPLVSIALCTYNGKDYIKEQLDSILVQTYPNLEVVIVDDCSSDGTIDILNHYKNKYPIIKLYQNEENLGFIRNFEKAISLTSGELIACSDQDDIWISNKIEKMVNQMESSVLIYSDSAYIDKNGNPLNKGVSDYRNLIEGRNLFVMDEDSGIWIAGHAALFKREILKFALPFNSYVNHDTWIVYAALLSGNIKAIPDKLTLYRQHGDNQVGGVGCHNLMNKKKQIVDIPSKKEQLRINKINRIQVILSILPQSEERFQVFMKMMLQCENKPNFLNRVRRLLLRLKYTKEIYAPRKRNILIKYFRSIRSF